MSGLDFLKKRTEFDAIREAISLLHKVMGSGCGLRSYDTVEQAEKVLYYLNSLLIYDGSSQSFYGACIIRDTDVNVFTYHSPMSDEEEAKMFERSRLEWNKKLQQEMAQKRWNQRKQFSKKSKYRK